MLAPAVAAGSTNTGAKSDAKGEAPAHGDLVRASATYKSAGVLKAKLSLTDYPAAAAHRTVVGAIFARRRGGRCDTSAGASLSLETDTKVAEVGLFPGSGNPKPARVHVSGNSIRLTAAASRFARKRFKLRLRARATN